LQEGFLNWPRIFFTSTVKEGLLVQLRRRAEQHAASIVDNIDDATHVVVFDKEVRRRRRRSSNGSGSSSSSCCCCCWRQGKAVGGRVEGSVCVCVLWAYDDQLFNII